MAFMNYTTPGLAKIEFEDSFFVTTELSRDENLDVKGYIESRGGIIKNFVTKTTDYLIYKDGEEEKVLMLSGNQTTPSNNKTVASAVLQMCQGELLSIANVPEGTRYSVVETDKAGYELVGIDKWFAPEDVEEDPDATTINLDEGSILGTIVPYHHNYISYTNKCLVTDISIQKVDEKGKGLEGAVFQLKQVNGSEEIEASLIIV